MIVLGLTGSIGMGKSTTARFFEEAGAHLWDADAAVHRLYGEGGAAVDEIARLAPEAVQENAVDRARLRAAILADPTLLPKIEAVIHPLVRADRAAFIRSSREAGAPIVVCDIPLLFETGDTSAFDAVVVVSAPEAVQRERVLERSGMTVEALEKILARQMPDAEKRARADFVIDTSMGLDAARAQVQAVIEAVQGECDA